MRPGRGPGGSCCRSRARWYAGLLLPATLADHLGLRELVETHLDLGAAPGRANVGDKLLTLVMSALAGGDCIDAAALRAGGTAGVVGFAVKAASTLGTFLRSFRWGHVRQLDAVTRHLLARAWAAEAGPMYDEPIVSHWHGATLDRAPSMSTRNDRLYDVSSAKLDALVDIARGTPGVIASRMTGAGFGDYTANLVWSDAVDRVRDRIEAEYPARSGCHPRVSMVQAVASASEEAP
jgi:hypothetical protein